MPLPIRDGNQSLTTLSTILVSNAHIPAHTVVSLGTQAITDIATAVASNSITISGGVYISDAQVALGNNAPPEAVQVGGYNLADNKLYPIAVDDNGVQSVSGTVTANAFGEDKVNIGNFHPIPLTDSGEQVSVSIEQAFGSAINVPISGTVTANVVGLTNSEENIIPIPIAVDGAEVAGKGFEILVPDASNVYRSLSNNSPLPISGTVTANLGKVSFEYGQSTTTANGVLIGWESDALGLFRTTSEVSPLPTQVLNSVTIGSAIPAGTNRIGVVTIGAGTVTIGAGTAQIGSVTASGTVTANLGTAVVQIVNAIEDGEGAIFGRDRNFPCSISGTVTIANIQGGTSTISSFTSTTPSTTLFSAVAGRKVATVFNEGAGNLHIAVGASCTTIGYQVRLSAGDYWEAPLSQTALQHTAVFATAGTARLTQVS